MLVLFQALKWLKRKLIGRRRFLLPLLWDIIPIFDFFYPKDKKTIIFGSDGTKNVTGDPRALFEDMRENHPEYNVYFFIKNPTEKGHIKPNTIRSLFIFLKARYAVTSNGIADFGHFRGSRKKKFVATWHGISIKSCGYTQKKRSSMVNYHLEKYTSIIDASIASSKFDAGILCMMFGYGGKIYLTGHPRNDHLVNFQSTGKKTLRKILPQVSKSDYVVLYAPTFRGMNLGPGFSSVQLFPFSDFDQKELSEFLKQNNIVLLLRLHVADRVTNINLEDERIIMLSHDLCIDVNKVLGDIDLVITDYSSIVYDFLVLNRPMMFIPYDLEDYENQRGLIIDNYDFWTPGPKINTMKEFRDYVEICIKGKPDSFEQRRTETRKVIHSRQTDCSTKRIIRLFEILN